MNKLPASTVKLISCSQVIKSVLNVVKELVENSLDAGSDCIDVRLEKSGLFKIEVSDNGPGICADHVQLLCQPYFTSKLSEFDDLASLQTHGFRGEALYSICSIGEISIITKTEYDELAMLHCFDCNGKIVERKPTHHGNGTTITVTNLFKDLPVRKQTYKTLKSQKEELKKIEDLLLSFGLIYHNVRWTLKNDKKEIWRKNRTVSLGYSIKESFKSSIMQELQELNINGENFAITAFVPKRNCNPQILGRSLSDRIFLSVNKRPVMISAVKKVLKESFNICNTQGVQKYPMVVLAITVDPSLVDVNLEPDKTKVLLHNIDEIISSLQVNLTELYTDNELPTVDGCTKANEAENIFEGLIDNDVEDSETNEKPKDLFESEDTVIDIFCANDVVVKDGCVALQDVCWSPPKNELATESDRKQINKELTHLDNNNKSGDIDFEKATVERKITEEFHFISPKPSISSETWRKGILEISPPVGILTTPSPIATRKSSTTKIVQKRKLPSPNDQSYTKLEKFFTSPERQKKRRRGLHVEHVSFDVNRIKKSYSKRNDISEKNDIPPTPYKIIGNIKESSIWILEFEKKFYAVERLRLSEILLNDQLLKKHRLEPKPLQRPIKLHPTMLGEQNFQRLCEMDTETSLMMPGRFINHKTVKGNGFLIKTSSSKNGTTLVCTHICDSIQEYGIQDLVEILDHEESPSDDFVEFYRPRKLHEWAKGEAKRLAQAAQHYSKDEMEEMLEWFRKQERFLEMFCIHGNIAKT